MPHDRPRRAKAGHCQQQTLLLTTLKERSVNGEQYLRELSERGDQPLLAVVR